MAKWQQCRAYMAGRCAAPYQWPQPGASVLGRVHSCLLTAHLHAACAHSYTTGTQARRCILMHIHVLSPVFSEKRDFPWAKRGSRRRPISDARVPVWGESTAQRGFWLWGIPFLCCPLGLRPSGLHSPLLRLCSFSIPLLFGLCFPQNWHPGEVPVGRAVYGRWCGHRRGSRCRKNPQEQVADAGTLRPEIQTRGSAGFRSPHHLYQLVIQNKNRSFQAW